MTGMKEGAGEDPFAEESSPSESPERDASESETVEEQESSTAETESKGATQQRTMQIPYKFRRDGVQDGRDRVPLFLMPDTKSAERDALRELEDRFDDDVSLTDLREALMMVGLDHLDEVAGHLEGWGYGMTFE
ncbi:hypothetical protein ACFPYI_19740 [Halomarina salina]|uniref:Uncharacterized protein n=1 Tax=Halomarina salina TaxID=1872699 RepID=A0ABD5RSR1_9EURY|nr:hypothetical protein [Halomarina salina]